MHVTAYLVGCCTPRVIPSAAAGAPPPGVILSAAAGTPESVRLRVRERQRCRCVCAHGATSERFSGNHASACALSRACVCVAAHTQRHRGFLRTCSDMHANAMLLRVRIYARGAGERLMRRAARSAPWRHPGRSRGAPPPGVIPGAAAGAPPPGVILSAAAERRSRRISRVSQPC